MSVFSHVRAYQTPERTTFGRRCRASRIGAWPTAGRAIAQLLSIGLTLFVLANLQDRTLTIMVALLGLAYASIRATTIANVFAFKRMAAAWDDELDLIKQAVVPGLRAEAAPALETRAFTHDLDRQLWLEYAGLAIVGAICLCYLLSAIIFGIAYQQLFM
jgi:hypothetical protein